MKGRIWLRPILWVAGFGVVCGGAMAQQAGDPAVAAGDGCGVYNIMSALSDSAMSTAGDDKRIKALLAKCEASLGAEDLSFLQALFDVVQRHRGDSDAMGREYRALLSDLLADENASGCSVFRTGAGLESATDDEAVDRAEAVLMRCEQEFDLADRKDLEEALRHARTRLTLPSTLDAAVDDTLSKLDDDNKASLRKMAREDLISLHFSLGMALRNELGLWGVNFPLLESACGGELCHPDDASMKIIEAVWERLQAREED